MSLAPISAIFLLLLLFFPQSAVATSSPTARSDKKTAYEILESFNFPVGLLPKGVTKYDLDETTGQFHAYWDGPCSFSLEGSYQLKYKSKISGYISKNKLTGLTGVSVKVLFFWLNIVEVVRNGDDIEFSVGIASASFLIDNFYECPQCGCGLDCVNGGQKAELEELSNDNPQICHIPRSDNIYVCSPSDVFDIEALPMLVRQRR